MEQLTKNELIMKYAALAYAVGFIVMGFIVFLFLPDMLMKITNDVSVKLFPRLPLYPTGENKFWLSMTVSMMAGVTVTSLLIFHDVKRYYSMAIPLCAMKFTSSLAGLGFFLLGFVTVHEEWSALANLVIFTTDFPLGLLMLILFLRVNREAEPLVRNPING